MFSANLYTNFKNWIVPFITVFFFLFVKFYKCLAPFTNTYTELELLIVKMFQLIEII